MYVAPPMRMGAWSMARVLRQQIEYYYCVVYLHQQVIQLSLACLPFSTFHSVGTSYMREARLRNQFMMDKYKAHLRSQMQPHSQEMVHIVCVCVCVCVRVCVCVYICVCLYTVCRLTIESSCLHVSKAL